MKMAGPMKDDTRGDADTLFISVDRKIVILWERKPTLSDKEESVHELFKQINRNEEAFSQSDTIFSLNGTVISVRRDSEYVLNATIVLGVYCKGGPTSVLNKLRDAGIPVIRDALEHLPPHSHTQPAGK